MNDRYQSTFAQLKEKNKSAFIPFWMIGDPSTEKSFEVIDTIAAHADILELGMPFSDPLADGPTIQASVTRALAAGTNTEKCFEVIAKVRNKYPEKPIGLLVYFNLAIQYGLDAFFRKCAAVGVDSVILPELPIESITMTDPTSSPQGEGLGVGVSIIEIAQKHKIHLTFLVSTNTPDDRLAAISEHASGFLYAISKPSITGAKSDLAPETTQMVQELKQKTDIPIVVGFGISEPSHVQALTKVGTDGIIIASKLYEFQDNLEKMSEFCKNCQEATIK